MNERIQKLAEQAGFRLHLDPGEFYTANRKHLPITEDLEKFAELIVRECVELNKQELAFNAFERLLNIYKEHFGVKE